MIFAGAGGHAKELFDLYLSQNIDEDVVFFDEISAELPRMFSSSLHLKNLGELKQFVTKNNKFVLATGDPKIRKLLYERLIAIGGEPQTIIASSSNISPSAQLGFGLNIMPFTLLSSQTTIGNGCLINTSATIHHDTTIGEFCEISPGARILGGVVIGNSCFIGSNAVVLPSIQMGSNVIVGAGAVVTRDVPSYSMVYGIPAKSAT